MWTYYINAMLELNKDLSTQSSYKRYALGKAFQAANQSDHMSEGHYLQYIELLYSNNPKDENIIEVFQKATNIYKTSLKIWLQCMRYYIQENNFRKVQEVFQNAKPHLGPKGVELWQLYLVYLKTQQNSETSLEFERLVYEISCQSHTAFNVLKAHVLELLATTVSMKRARKTYRSFIKHFPCCYEVHETMAELESKQVI